MYPMDEMKLCFNYDDSPEQVLQVARDFAKRYELTVEDYDRIVNYIKDIQQKHKDGTDGKSGGASVSAAASANDEGDADYDIVTTITKPGQEKLTLRFNYTDDPRVVAHAFVTDNGLS